MSPFGPKHIQHNEHSKESLTTDTVHLSTAHHTSTPCNA